MNLRVFMILVTILGVVYGVGFLLVPDFLVSLYGASPDPAAIMGFRYFGATLVTVGLNFLVCQGFS
jgi:hypothetical protein